MDKNNILISTLNIENISQKELSDKSSVDLIKEMILISLYLNRK